MKRPYKISEFKIEFLKDDAPAGPPDKRVIADLEKLHPLPQSFLSFSELHHGMAPVDGRIGSKKIRIGRFLSLIDNKSKLPKPFQPHFEDPTIDSRVMRSIAAVIWFESAASRALYYGERLIPFAALFCGDARPEEMCMDRGYVDFLCFDYGKQSKEPTVVHWLGEKALEEFFLYDDDEIEKPRYSRFTKPVSKDFEELLSLLN